MKPISPPSTPAPTTEAQFNQVIMLLRQQRDQLSQQVNDVGLLLGIEQAKTGALQQKLTDLEKLVAKPKK